MPPLLKQSAAPFSRELPPLLTPLYNAKVGTWLVVSDGEYLCGSAPEAQLQLEISGIEPRHCLLTFSQQTLLLTRISRRVWVNELPVMSHVYLQPGDVISLGSVSFRIETADPTGELINDPEKPLLYLGDVQSPHVTYVGHSDQRFTDVFTCNRPDNDADNAAALAEIREQELLLLRRESEIEQKEASLNAASERLQHLHQNLQASRDDLEQKQSEFHTNQRMFEESQASFRSERQRLLHEAERLQQQHATLAAVSAQLTAAKDATKALQAQLDSALRSRDEALATLEQATRESDTLTQQLQQSTQLIAAQTHRAEALQSELQLLRSGTLDDQQALGEQQRQIQTRQQQLEQESHAIEVRQRAIEQSRLEQESRAEGLEAAIAELDSRAASVQEREARAELTHREAESLRQHWIQQTARLQAQQDDLQQRQNALNQISSELEQQQQQLLAARAAAETNLDNARRCEADSQRKAAQLSTRQQELDAYHGNLTALQQALEVQQSELHNRKTQLADLEITLQQREETLVLREQELEQALKDTSSARPLEELETQREQLSKREQALAAQELALHQRVSELESSRLTLQEQIQQLQQREQDIQAQATEFNERIAEWRNERRHQRETLAAREQQLSQQQLDLQAATAALRSGQKDLNALQQRLATANEQLEIRRQLLQDQQEELSAERDHAIAELTSSRVMIVELRNALEQARSKSAVTAELKARLAEQDAIINHLHEAVATSREELVQAREQAREQAEQLSQLATEAARTPAQDQSELLSVIAARDAMISDLQTQLLQTRESIELETEGFRRSSKQHLEQQASLQKQLVSAEKGLRDRDVLIRELRNHLAAMSGRQQQQPPAPVSAGPPERRETPEEPLDDSPDDVISNLNSSDFFINLGAALEPSTTTTQTSSASTPVPRRDQFLELDVDHPDDEPAAADDDFHPSITPAQPEYFSSGHSPRTTLTTPAEPSTAFRNTDLQTPGALSAELISLLEMDFSLNKPEILAGSETEQNSVPDGLILDRGQASQAEEPPQSLLTTTGAAIESGSAEITSHGPDIDAESRSETPASDSVESEQAVRLFMENLLSNLRGNSSSATGHGSEKERGQHNQSFAHESTSATPSQTRTATSDLNSGRAAPISFIDRYMSGELQLGDTPDISNAVAEDGFPAGQGSLLQSPTVLLPRPRTDLRKLRDDMQNIRRLATEVAEQAIAHHTIRQQTSGLLPRAAAVVGCLSVLVWLKPWLLVWIQNPLYVEWGTLSLLLVSCLELFRKLVSTMLLRRARTNVGTNFRRRHAPGDAQSLRVSDQDLSVDPSDDAPIF
jgi:hypothetical protein